MILKVIYAAIEGKDFGVLLMERLMFLNATVEIVCGLPGGLCVPYVFGDRR